jgi:hypothetical protein
LLRPINDRHLIEFWLFAFFLALSRRKRTGDV